MASPPINSPALITGGSSGIGLAMAMALAGRGHPLVLIARDADRLAAAGRRVAEARPDLPCLCLAADVADAGAVAAAVARGAEAFGPYGWVIANAGIARPGLFRDQPLSDHLEQMQINYFGALHTAHAARGTMARGGRLVFVSSGAALYGIYGYSAYAPSKFAVRGLAETLRLELAPDGISVTLAYPPDTDTPQLVAENRTKPEITRRITAGGGLASPETVARRILARAEAGAFLVTQGVMMELLMRSQDLLGPYMRWMQRRAIARG